MAEVRLKRIESQIRREIAAMISLGQIKDPRLMSLTTVTAVKVSRDLGHAKVWISHVGERRELEEGVAALNHAAGFIQGVLGRRMQLRTFPRLAFMLDDSMERGFRVVQKLREVGL